MTKYHNDNGKTLEDLRSKVLCSYACDRVSLMIDKAQSSIDSGDLDTAKQYVQAIVDQLFEFDDNMATNAKNALTEIKKSISDDKINIESDLTSMVYYCSTDEEQADNSAPTETVEPSAEVQ